MHSNVNTDSPFEKLEYALLPIFKIPKSPLGYSFSNLNIM